MAEAPRCEIGQLDGYRQIVCWKPPVWDFTDSRHLAGLSLVHRRVCASHALLMLEELVPDAWTVTAVVRVYEPATEAGPAPGALAGREA